MRRWSTKMIWGDHWTPKSPLFSASRHRQLFSFPPPWPNWDIKLSDSFGSLLDFSHSRSFCAVFPFFDYIASPWIPASPRIFTSPLFLSPLYHYSGGVFTLCFFFFFFLSLYSQLGGHSLWSPSYTFYPSNSTGYCWNYTCLSLGMVT